MKHDSLCIIGVFLSSSTGKVSIYVTHNAILFIELVNYSTCGYCQFPSSKYTYSDVLAGDFGMRMMARSYTRHRLLKNCAYWFKAIDISGCIDI